MRITAGRSRSYCLGFLGAAALAGAAQASILYTADGSNYTQNFDSLPNTPTNVSLGSTPTGWIDDTASPAAGNFSIVGWYLYHPLSQTEGGSNGHQRVRIGAGTANTGAFMSWGANSSTDRALGDLGSNTLNATSGPGGDIYIAMRLTNNTGHALDTFTLSFTGEQWRDGGATTPAAQTMTFGYSTTATTVNDSNSLFTNVAGLAFTSPTFTNTGSGAALDGNAAANRTALSATVTGLTWASGADLWLRWDDINDVGNDHGLGIDDLTFSATTAPAPEPASITLLAGGLAVLSRRRRRNR